MQPELPDPAEAPEPVIVKHPETDGGVILAGATPLAFCPACSEPDPNHRGHLQHLPDGAQCPCKGECDGSLKWPSPATPR